MGSWGRWRYLALKMYFHSCICGVLGETGTRMFWDGVLRIHGHIRNIGYCWVEGGGSKGYLSIAKSSLCNGQAY